LSTQKLYRVIVAQRIRFTPGTDVSFPTQYQPPETEGSSVTRDVTDYIKTYKIQQSREAISTEATIEFISPGGLLNPENYNSTMNLSPLDGVTYTPLLAEGNQITIYRVPNIADLSTPSTWIPRFTGVIRAVDYGTDAGQDSLSVTAADILSLCSKTTIQGQFSPIVRTSTILPYNSFYTLSTLTEALSTLRNVNASTSTLTPGNWVQPSYTDMASRTEPAGITSDILSRLIYWDQDDVYWSNGHQDDIGGSGGCDICYEPRFAAAYYGEPKNGSRAANYIPVTNDTALHVYGLNGYSWLNTAGTVTKDLTRVNTDPLGSLKLMNATLQFSCRKIPTVNASLLRVLYRIEDGSSFNITITRRAWIPSQLTYDHTYEVAPDRVVLNQTVTGQTLFNASALGGTLLNTPSGTNYQFQELDITVPAVPAAYALDPVATVPEYIVYDVVITSTGTVWMDSPSWVFTMIDRDSATGLATYKQTNLLALPKLERWTTTDGLTFFDPDPNHRSMLPKNTRVVLRRLRSPYQAGTSDGFGPIQLQNRYLPNDYVYEQELVEGQDYTALTAKGGIQLASALSRIEIFVQHGYYDLISSSHMEAAQMLGFLLTTGAGIPASLITLENTGIVLNAINLGIKTSITVMDAIKDLLKQLPSNYMLYSDGYGKVWGRFLQQEGSPRLYDPIIQAPITPTDPTLFNAGQEYWYCATNLMPDGKETLASNMLSTVDYQNYFDGAHASNVSPTTSPCLQMKMSPNAVGLVIRRAKAYKSVAEVATPPTVSPLYQWTFNDPVIPLIPTIPVTAAATGWCSISATNILTLTSPWTGTFALGSTILGASIHSGTTIYTLLSGTLGGVGSTYSLLYSVAPGLVAAEEMAAVPAGTLALADAAGVFTTVPVQEMLT